MCNGCCKSPATSVERSDARQHFLAHHPGQIDECLSRALAVEPLTPSVRPPLKLVIMTVGRVEFP